MVFKTSWLIAFENRHKFYIGSIVLISLTTLAVAVFRNPVSFDAFWHLKTGEDWLLNGLRPWEDHYSYTFKGHSIANQPVAFQALLYLTVSQFGIHGGFIFVRSIAYAMVLAATVLLLRQRSSHALLYALILPVIVFLLEARIMVRPELFSYVFSIIALMLYFRAGNKVSPAAILPMALLMLVWTNYHNSVVGYVIFAGYFIDCAVHQSRARASLKTWFNWLGWGVALLIVGFINRDISHPLIEAFTFPKEWKVFILEYLPLKPFLDRNPAIYLVGVLAAFVPIMAIMQRRWGILVVWLVLAHSAFTLQRMVAPAGIVIILLLAYLLIQSGFPGKWVGKSTLASCATGVVCLLAIGSTAYANIHRAISIMEENQTTLHIYPEPLVDYMIERGIGGRIFNQYGIGGYLIYRLSPDSKVYIDGRTQILYPLEHMHRYRAASSLLKILRQEREKYGFELVLFRIRQPIEEIIVGLEGFGLDFVDVNYVLYRHGSSNFPVHGYLLSQPACWHPGMQSELAREREAIQRILPPNSTLIPFSSFLDGYVNAADKQAYFDSSFEQQAWTDHMRRFAAFRALESGDYHLARILFGGLKVRNTGDFLAPAMAMVLAGESELASLILADFSRTQLQFQFQEHIQLYLFLYKQLSDHLKLEDSDIKFMESLRTELFRYGLDPEDFEPTAKALCALPAGTLAGLGLPTEGSRDQD